MYRPSLVGKSISVSGGLQRRQLPTTKAIWSGPVLLNKEGTVDVATLKGTLPVHTLTDLFKSYEWLRLCVRVCVVLSVCVCW